MLHNYKPEGYNTVSPYLIVRDGEGTIRFLNEAFDAVELRRFQDDGGRLMHAEVRVDDTVVMLADAAEGWPSIEAHVHIYVPDVDESYQRALTAGGTSVQEPAEGEDEDRRGAVLDPGGTTWWISTRFGRGE